ncbi:glycosyltransferase family 4 protein [Clostridium sp. JS66]|uniref:glycosyltransferase family 4 protein n=1 Tax=Clostridium sp. JS66 TaxID=3064705 RepID=UPI00298E3D70|nr:glycosyltransferase family 4 protein [Clostridium sp. JS66]WPC40819.1 glycosyltransferase family 4 protein [Clostridium sp. JS66]
MLNLKKILHIIAQRPEKTGSGTYLQALIEQGEKKGYCQAVIAGIPANEPNTYFKTDVKFYPVVFETKTLPFPVVGMTDIMPYKSTMYRKLNEDMLSKWKNAFSEVLTKSVMEFKPDVIITHHLWILSAMVKEMFPLIKTIAICHGTDLRQMNLAPNFNNYVSKYCRSIDNIAALHEDQKNEIIKKYQIDQNKITVVGVGFNPNIFYTSDTEKNMDKIKLIYAGKLNFAKGIPSLIKSYNKLDIDKNSIELILAGSGTGSQFKAIEKIAEESRLKVILKGSIPQNELSKLFRESHLFVFPSFFEGLPLVLTEALASDMLIVTTNLPGVKDFFGDYINKKGLIEYVKMPSLKSLDEPFEEDLPNFEEEFSKAIENQLEKIKNKYYKKDPKVKEVIDNMSWKGVFNKIENLFNS